MSSFLQDSASHAEACREFAADIRRAVRSGYNGHVADRIADIPAPGEAALLNAAAFDSDLIAKLLDMGDHSLSSVLKQVSLHDIAMLPHALRMRMAALTARLADGQLSLSDAMAIGADDVREGYACQSMFRDYAPFIGQLMLRRLDLARNGLCCSDGMALQHVLSAQLQLRHLDLSGNTEPSTESIMPAISSAKSLTFLDLSRCFQYNDKTPILQPLSHLSHLAHLNILGCQIPTSELRDHASILATLTALTHLQLGSFHEMELSAATAITHHIPPTIRHLTLSWGEPASLAQTTYASLPDGLRRLTALTYLCLGDASHDSKYGKWPPEHAILNSVFAALAALPQLAHFAAPLLRATRRSIAHLAVAPALRHLVLTPEIDSNLSELTLLTALDIRDDCSSSQGSRWCHLKPLTALRMLHLELLVKSPPALQALRAALAGIVGSLEDLKLDVDTDGSIVPPRTYTMRPTCAVGLFSQLSRLTRLVIEDWQNLEVGPRDLGRAVQPLRSLRHLRVTGIGEQLVVQIPQAAATRLTMRHPWGRCGGDAAAPAGDASSTEGEDEGLAGVSPAAALGQGVGTLTALTALHLAGLSSDKAGETAELVNALSALRELRVLGLQQASLGTPAAAALAALLRGGCFPALEELVVSHNNFTGAAVAALTGGLAAARRLRRLDMQGLCGHDFERPREKYSTDDESMGSDDEEVDEDGDSDVFAGSEAGGEGDGDGEGDPAGGAAEWAAGPAAPDVAGEVSSDSGSSDSSMGVAEIDGAAAVVVDEAEAATGVLPTVSMGGQTVPGMVAGVGASLVVAMMMSASGEDMRSEIEGGEEAGHDDDGNALEGLSEDESGRGCSSRWLRRYRRRHATEYDDSIDNDDDLRDGDSMLNGEEYDEEEEDEEDAVEGEHEGDELLEGDGGSRGGPALQQAVSGILEPFDLPSTPMWMPFSMWRRAWLRACAQAAGVADGAGGSAAPPAVDAGVALAPAAAPQVQADGAVGAAQSGAQSSGDATQEAGQATDGVGAPGGAGVPVDVGAPGDLGLGGGGAQTGTAQAGDGGEAAAVAVSPSGGAVDVAGMTAAAVADPIHAPDSEGLAVAAVVGEVAEGASDGDADVAAESMDGDAGEGHAAHAEGAGSDGADDADMPWWLHEATAEALWRALLPLPLDQGIEL